MSMSPSVGITERNERIVDEGAAMLRRQSEGHRGLRQKKSDENRPHIETPGTDRCPSVFSSEHGFFEKKWLFELTSLF